MTPRIYSVRRIMSLRKVSDSPDSSRVSGALGASGNPLPSHSSPIWRLANMEVPCYLRDHERKKKPTHTATRPTWIIRRRLPPMLFQKLASTGEEGGGAAALCAGGHEPSGSCAPTLFT